MASWALLTLAVAMTVVAVCLGFVTVVDRRRSRESLSHLATVIDHQAAVIDTLHASVRELQDRSSADYVITAVGERGREAGPAGSATPVSVPDQLVLSTTLGEPLLRTVALGHGVRRALSPQSRNRIAFAMRQQLRSSRKERKAEVRQALRQVRSDRREEAR